MGLFENMKAEPVSKLNLREPVTVGPQEVIRDVARAMRDKNLGCAIVIDEESRPLGMFTESMLTQMVAKDPQALDQPVAEHTPPEWAQVKVTDPILSVLAALDKNNTRFLTVIDDTGKLCGLTGQKGLMEYIADHFPGQVMVQRVGQKPSMRSREGA